MWFGPRGPKVYTLDVNDPYNTIKPIEQTPKADASPEVIYHPAHAWIPRSYIPDTLKPLEGYYMLPDGKTAIAGVKDIGRSLLLRPVVPGGTFIGVDDAVHRAYIFDVAADGSLVNERIYAENAFFGVLPLSDGSVIVPDGYLRVIRDGKVIKRMRTPERAVCAVTLGEGIALICRNSVWKIQTSDFSRLH
jgi:hypothetical protein